MDEGDGTWRVVGSRPIYENRWITVEMADVGNWELPGGIVDEGETPAETAVREVIEETGYRPRSIALVANFEPMIGMVTSPHHVYVAHGAERIQEPTERDEGRFEWVPIGKVPQLIASGEIRNSGT